MSRVPDHAPEGVSTKANWQTSSSKEGATSKTVIEHVLSRLKEIGVSKVFGVAGDFAFPIEDAIEVFPGVEWIGCCNELNAAYAADGYGRRMKAIRLRR